MDKYGNVKTSYTVSQNLLYLMKNAWKYNPIIFIIALVQAMTAVMIPLLGVILPKVALEAVENQWKMSHLVFAIGGIAIVTAILNFVQSRMSTQFGIIQDRNRDRYVNEVEKVVMCCDYELVEDPDMQIKMEEAADVVFTGNYRTGVNGMENGSRDLLISIMGMVTFSTILIGLNPIIVLILVLTSLVTSYVSHQVSVYEHNHRKNWTPIDKKLEYIHKNLIDVSKGKDIRLYGCVEWFHTLLEAFVIERAVWLKKIMLRRFGVSICNAGMVLLRDGIAIGWVAYEVMNYKISIADFMLYYGAISQLSGYISRIVGEVTSLKSASLEVCILRKFLELEDGKPKIKNPLPGKEELPLSITFDNVSFTYPNSKKEIIKDVSFTIEKGENLAIVGSNGAGKTTLIKLLCGFYKPTKGRILINETPLEEYGRDNIYQLFSAVYQDIMILPFTVAQNVAMEEENKIDKEKVKQCLKLAGVEKRLPDLEAHLVKEAYDDGLELSGGEKQKLLLARAIYKDAPILVLDEPTAALDPISENQLYLKYNELTKGKTSIFISHRLASTHFCDRIFFFKDGKITEQGTHEELLNQGQDYATMYEVQSSYYREVEH